MSENSKTPLLDTVRIPADMADFTPDQLKQLADELRVAIGALFVPMAIPQAGEPLAP